MSAFSAKEKLVIFSHSFGIFPRKGGSSCECGGAASAVVKNVVLSIS